MNSSQMQSPVSLHCIGVMHTPFAEKFGIPRQPNLVAAQGRLEFVPPYNVASAIQGLEAASHVWVIWQFHACPDTTPERWQPTVRPPRLGGNQRLGVFSTRSGFRPNRIGMSVCRLLEVTDCGSLLLSGVDMLDGTPVLDVKPYVPYADAVTEAHLNWAETSPPNLPVVWSAAAGQSQLDAEQKTLIEAVLAQDPRPAYHDSDREYGVRLAGFNVRFSVSDEGVRVLNVEPE